MENPKTPPVIYDRYPGWIVLLSVGLNLLIYAAGALILFQLSAGAGISYLVLAVWLEFRVMRLSCVKCVYYGSSCAFGKGWLCARILKRGDPSQFDRRDITWRSVIPDFLAILIPFAGAILLLFRKFTWTVAVPLGLLTILFFAGTAAVRSNLACPHCRQRVNGCPAERLFSSHEENPEK